MDASLVQAMINYLLNLFLRDVPPKTADMEKSKPASNGAVAVKSPVVGAFPAGGGTLPGCC